MKGKPVERQGRKAKVSAAFYERMIDRPQFDDCGRHFLFKVGDGLNKVLREEKKFLISIAEFRSTSARLEKVMMQRHVGDCGTATIQRGMEEDDS